MNLYSKLVPAGRFKVAVQRGLELVYFDADNAGALAVFHEPSCEMLPAILIVWPTTVVAFSLKVTATVATGVAHPVPIAVDVALVEVGAIEVAAAEVGTTVLGLLETGGLGFELPEPWILMSAQLR